MRYTWDFNEIRNNRDVLIKLLGKSTNEDDIYEIETAIKMYDQMLSLAKRKVDSYEMFDDTIRTADINDLINSFYCFYTKDKLPILNILLPTVQVTQKVPEKTIELIETSDTNDDLVKVTLDFFEKMTTPYIYSEADNILKKNNLININFSRDFNSYPGVTFIDEISKKKYIAMSRNNEILDFPQLAHELFHYIFSDCEVRKIFEHNIFYLTEVEGMLANILFGEYFKTYYGGEDGIDGDIFKNYFLGCFCSQINDLVIRHGVINAMDDKGKIRLQKLNKYTNFYDLPTFDTPENIIPYLNTPQETDITYSLSYLVALDLYYIYKYDRDFAFYILKNLRYVKDENDIVSLLNRNDITFFKDEYKNLKDYIGLNKKKIKKIGDNNGKI